MIEDPTTGWREATVTINGRLLTFAESMTLRVAVTSFRTSLSAPGIKQKLGQIGTNYDVHLQNIEALMMQELP